MDYCDHEEIINAARNLDLPQKATIRQIKEHYRIAMKKWHPDNCDQDAEKCKEQSNEIIRSYKILVDYYEHYQLDLSLEGIKKQKTIEQELDEIFRPDFV